MAQVTIYLDDDGGRTGAEPDVYRWLVGARELAGAWPDFPDLRDLRASTGEDRPRGRL